MIMTVITHLSRNQPLHRKGFKRGTPSILKIAGYAIISYGVLSWILFRKLDMGMKDIDTVISHQQLDLEHEKEQKKNQISLNGEKSPVVIAYAVSFVKCGDHQNSPAGLIDASLVLRHSIYKISSRYPSSGSKYDFKMYAIVHTQAQACAEVLGKVGYEVIVKDPPLQKNEIRGEELRKNIHKERCCGHDEFIKLYAYTLPEKIIVHLDLDVALFKPMDHLYDAILYDKDSKHGQAARKLIQLERPEEKLPDTIGAFLTRDWSQVKPGKWPPGYQAGFLVARRDPSVLTELVEIIKEGDYQQGWGHAYGWGHKGYGGYIGAMAMQGLVAYYYDHVRTKDAVELNQCLFNHMGVDVKHRNKCRNGRDTCEDCTVTPIDQIYSMHFTTCRKPWLCQATGDPRGNKNGVRGAAINTQFVKVKHCLEMSKEWHILRSNLENTLYNITNDETIHDGVSGDYEKSYFLGHCADDGKYIKFSGTSESIERLKELYP